jgi:hypothetical protein
MKKNKINKLIEKINNRLEEQRPYKTPLKGPKDPTSNPNYGLDVLGCTDPAAANYLPQYITDDGSCEYIYGCNDEAAFNYDPNAAWCDGCPSNDVYCCCNYGLDEWEITTYCCPPNTLPTGNVPEGTPCYNLISQLVGYASECGPGAAGMPQDPNFSREPRGGMSSSTRRPSTRRLREIKKELKKILKNNLVSERDLKVTCKNEYGVCGKADECAKCESMSMGPEGGEAKVCSCASGASIDIQDKWINRRPTDTGPFDIQDKWINR